MKLLFSKLKRGKGNQVVTIIFRDKVIGYSAILYGLVKFKAEHLERNIL